MSKRLHPSAAPERRKAHHSIRALEVTAGFMKGARFEFKDGLNCIIGGRGTGKTTVIEDLRYVLGLMPDAETSPARSRALCSLVAENLANGRVRLEVETKRSTVYHIERAWNDPPHVSDERHEPLAVSLSRDAIFQADVYSQNEIEEIARNPSFQLVLIDKFVDEDVRTINAEIGKLERALDQNAADLVQLDREIAALVESAEEVKGLELKLKALQTAGPDAQRMNTAHAHKALRAKERKTLETVVGDVRKVKTDFDALANSSIRRLGSRIDTDVAEGPNRDAFASIASEAQQLVAVIERAEAMIDKACDHAEAAIAGQDRLLVRRHAKQESDYQSLVEKSTEESGKVAERAKVQQRHLEATTARKELEPRRRERRARARARAALGQARRASR